jgi:nucleoside-diphosphate-sugar epimerase
MGWLLLTGASGFLGQRLVAEALQRGYGVLALLRRPDQAPLRPGPGLEILAGDLRDPASLEAAARRLRALDRQGAAIHSAALISYRRRDRRANFEVNLGGTEALCAALGRAELGRLLLVSSVAVLGPAPSPQRPLDEDSPFAGQQLASAYLHSKRAAQAAAFEWGREAGRDVRAVLPGAIFGPTERSNTARFLARLRARGAPLWVAPGSLTPVDVDDAARGTLLALEKGRAGRSYLLVERPRTLLDLYGAACRALAKPAPLGVVPPVLWAALVQAARALDRLRPLGLLAPEALELLGQHFAFDGSRARRELGFEARPLEALLERALRIGPSP